MAKQQTAKEIISDTTVKKGSEDVVVEKDLTASSTKISLALVEEVENKENPEEPIEKELKLKQHSGDVKVSVYLRQAGQEDILSSSQINGFPIQKGKILLNIPRADNDSIKGEFSYIVKCERGYEKEQEVLFEFEVVNEGK